MLLARGTHDPFCGAKRVRGHHRPAPFVRQPLTCEDSAGEALRRVQRTLLGHVHRRPPSAPLGYALGYGGTRRPLRANPKWPLTCTNMVGDTGIEPVSSSSLATGHDLQKCRLTWKKAIQ